MWIKIKVRLNSQVIISSKRATKKPKRKYKEEKIKIKARLNEKENRAN